MALAVVAVADAGPRVHHIDGAALLCDVRTARAGFRVQCQGRALGARGLRMRVRTERRGRWRRRLFGDDSIECAAFDAAMRVVAPDPDYARAWLCARAREHLVAASDVDCVVADGSVSVAGTAANERDVEHIVRAAAALCSRGERLAGEWREVARQLRARSLPAATVWQPNVGGFQFGAGAAATIVSTSHARLSNTPRRLMTHVFVRREATDRFAMYPRRWPPMARPLEAASLKETWPHARTLGDDHIRVHCDDRAAMFARLSRRVRNALAVGDVAVVSAGDRIEIREWGLVLSAERLRGRAQIAHKLAGHEAFAAGAYR